MIYLKTNPVGIDKPIQTLQNTIYSFCQSEWGLTEAQIISFGRVHRVDDKLRYYDTDYKEHDMLLDSQYAVQYFFLANEDATFIDIFERETGLYMFVNLETVKSTITYRADEEAKMDIYNRLKPTEYFRGFGNIDLPQYDAKMDIQPFHAFKIILNLRYQ